MTEEQTLALADQIIGGQQLSQSVALDAMLNAPRHALYVAADRVRKHFRGNSFQTCSIINARSGRCSEDCKWCAQSSKHSTGISEYPLIGADEAVAMAVNNARKGVARFSLVTSGRTMSDSEIDRACDIYRRVAENAKIDLCASMGLLTRSQLQKLYDVGLRHYHCNIESAPSFFPSLCSTHTIEDKLRTIRAAREIGFGICSGGIIGMGESAEQRVEMAVFLRDVVGAVSIPVNVLVPIKGTRLENQPPLSPDEIKSSFAIFRLCNPQAEIRMAGGQINFVGERTEVLACGVDASIVGDMLTTTGTGGIVEDFDFFRRCGRKP